MQTRGLSPIPHRQTNGLLPPASFSTCGTSVPERSTCRAPNEERPRVLRGWINEALAAVTSLPGSTDWEGPGNAHSCSRPILSRPMRRGTRSACSPFENPRCRFLVNIIVNRCVDIVREVETHPDAVAKVLDEGGAVACREHKHLRFAPNRSAALTSRARQRWNLADRVLDVSLIAAD